MPSGVREVIAPKACNVLKEFKINFSCGGDINSSKSSRTVLTVDAVGNLIKFNISFVISLFSIFGIGYSI